MSRPRARWSARAQADLIAIGEHIAVHKPRAARSWVEKLRLRTLDAAQSPLAQHRVPELERDDIREAIHRGYRIVYLVTAGGIDVLTVFEGYKVLDVDILDEQ